MSATRERREARVRRENEERGHPWNWRLSDHPPPPVKPKPAPAERPKGDPDAEPDRGRRYASRFDAKHVAELGQGEMFLWRRFAEKSLEELRTEIVRLRRDVARSERRALAVPFHRASRRADHLEQARQARAAGALVRRLAKDLEPGRRVAEVHRAKDMLRFLKEAERAVASGPEGDG